MTNRKTKADRPSLSDWDAKRSLLRALYSVLSDPDLITQVASNLFKTTEQRSAAEAKYDRTEWVIGFSPTLKKWHDGVSPLGDQSGVFWDLIIGDFKLSVSKARLWNCSIGEFVELFSGEANIAIAVDELLCDKRAKLTQDARAQLQTRFGPSAGPGAASSLQTADRHAKPDVSAEPAERLHLLPEDMEEITVSSLLDDETAYVTAWSILLGHDRRMWINSDRSIGNEPKATQHVKITRRGDTVYVERATIGDHKYSCEPIGDTSNLFPVVLE